MSFKKTAGTLVVGAVLGLGIYYGIEKHHDSKVEANVQETIKNMDESKVDLHLVAESLKSKMNEQAEYTVSKSTATIKCFNVYTEEVKYMKNIITGENLKNPFNKEEDWVISEPTIWTYAQAKSSFEHKVPMVSGDVNVSNDKLQVEVDYPYLDKGSISVDMKTFKELDAEKIDGKTYKSGMNNDAHLLDMKQNTERNNNNSIKANARTAWQVKYIEKAPEEIDKIYDTDATKRAELESNTVESVKALLEPLLLDTLKALGFVQDDVELEVIIRK
ncbi:MAG: hypothetical protein IJ086_01265 [Clostridium sp.]|nr:hypothetical protein [Clostridium sp.]